MTVKEARRERRREQAREEILAAAGTVILQKGIAGLTLTAVARELQLTKAALYYYFPSKEALVFELVFLGLQTHAEVVGPAVAATTSGADAIETLIRVSTAHYAEHRDAMRLAYMIPQVSAGGAGRFDPEQLERVRPFNDMIYGAVAEKIRADQRAGRISESVDGRRLAFLAHMAVLGMLTIEGVVEATDPMPLIHSRETLVDELVATFTARIRTRG